MAEVAWFSRNPSANFGRIRAIESLPLAFEADELGVGRWLRDPVGKDELGDPHERVGVPGFWSEEVECLGGGDTAIATDAVASEAAELVRLAADLSGVSLTRGRIQPIVQGSIAHVRMQ